MQKPYKETYDRMGIVSDQDYAANGPPGSNSRRYLLCIGSLTGLMFDCPSGHRQGQVDFRQARATQQQASGRLMPLKH